MNLYSLLRPLLFALPPETAHKASIAALHSGAAGLLSGRLPPADPRLRVEVAGLDFVNPVGLAAGYDKDAQVPLAALGLGFGFAEVGTVTPRPQPGNPRPRVFRLPQHEALINRLGFNNGGHAGALRRLEAVASRDGGIIGVNIGAKKDSPDLVADYVEGIRTFFAVATYFTVNISSPNTPGLRNLQQGEALRRLLGETLEARDSLVSQGGGRPVFLKIAPDLDDKQMDEIAGAIAEVPLDGLIVSNTTLSRKGINDPLAAQAGGLSGRPLFEASTIVLARMRQRLGGKIAIIGVGGVDSAQAAIAKIEAGADLVQLYTGLVYRGPSLPAEIVRGLGEVCDREGLASIRNIRGRKTAEWAAKRLPAEA